MDQAIHFYLYQTNNENEVDWTKLTTWLCQKENNGGADGLLLVLPSTIADAQNESHKC